MEGGVHSSAERMVSQLLTEIDGIQEIHEVVVIAATNRIDMIHTCDMIAHPIQSFHARRVVAIGISKKKQYTNSNNGIKDT